MYRDTRNILTIYIQYDGGKVVPKLGGKRFSSANVAHDRRKRKADGTEVAPRGGFFYSLTKEMQQSLVEYARRAAKGARADGRVALQAHDADKLVRREERLTVLLNAAVDAYAYSLELFDAWTERP